MTDPRISRALCMAVQRVLREGKPVTVAGIVNALRFQGFTPEEAEREGAAILQRAYQEVEKDLDAHAPKPKRRRSRTRDETQPARQ